MRGPSRGKLWTALHKKDRRAIGLLRQRNQARRVAVLLEQENAELLRQLLAARGLLDRAVMTVPAHQLPALNGAIDELDCFLRDVA